MQYMLDTNICIYLIKEKSVQLIRRFQKNQIEDIGISSITLSELEFGIEKSHHKQKNRLALTHFLAPLQIAVYDSHAAQHYGRVRYQLENQGKPIGPLDTMIAAHALSLHCTLITNNEREFSRVANLKIENWVSSP